MVSTLIVNVVRTLLLLELPVAVSFWTLNGSSWIKISSFASLFDCQTFLIVLALIKSPAAIRLYACHMSSDSSGIKTTELVRTNSYYYFDSWKKFSISILTHCLCLFFDELASWLWLLCQILKGHDFNSTTSVDLVIQSISNFPLLMFLIFFLHMFWDAKKFLPLWKFHWM